MTCELKEVVPSFKSITECECTNISAVECPGMISECVKSIIHWQRVFRLDLGITWNVFRNIVGFIE
jgi:hypothetical protein